jgi:acetyl esterase/lipase
MRTPRWRIIGAWLISAAAVLAAPKKENPLLRMKPVPATEQIPTIDFFRPPLFRSVRLNPTGSHFSALINGAEDRTDLVVYEFATNKWERLSGGKDMDINTCHWLTEKRFLINLTREKRYAFGLFAAEVGKLTHAIPIERYNVVSLIGTPEEDRLKPIIWIRKSAVDHGDDGGVVQIDAERAYQRISAMELTASITKHFPPIKAPGDPVGYHADANGHLAFGVISKDGVRTLYRLEGEKWERCPVDLDTIQIIGPGEKPNELLVLPPREGNNPRPLQRMDAVTGKLGEILYRDDNYDLANLSIYRRPSDHRIIGLRYQQRMPKSVWFDPAYQALQAGLEEVLPNVSVAIAGSDRAENKFFVTTASDRAPGQYYYFDRASKKLTFVTSTAPWIDPERMQPMQGLTFKTRDGVTLEGYVTLPAGTTKEKPAPLVVVAHGGPWARDNWGWNATAQFLASRGYAVFQPNYRGSSGYGVRIPEEDNWAFRKMHDDVTDGVNTLLKTGLIDRNRMAIMGASFGGYLSLCGAVYEPDMYRCAVTIAGVFDWEKVMKESKSTGYFPAQYGTLRRRLGDPKQDAEKFEAISPVRHAERIKIPIYVAHGTDDVVASVAQSKRLIAELKKYGVTHEAQIEREEGHGFQMLENRVELYTAIEKFLEKHLKSAGAPAPAAAPIAAQ